MKIERLILIPFLGNYLINNVVAALAALFPASQTGGLLTMQYVMFVVFALIASGLIAWWYFGGESRGRMMKTGVIFGVVGFLVSVATTFVSGLAGVVLQTGSLAEVVGVLPRFFPFLWNWSTLVVLAYWVIPAVVVGWYLQMKSGRAQTPMM
ncbi:hypothetical protein FJY93_00165 [Candidatus Kaiserbacteria bacterium]|nr:hypothetical protein [Candidatus Kaiserbacteria bacterium]